MSESYPRKNKIANMSVEMAIIESAKIMSIFRLYRSAQTPANGERKKAGRKPHTMEIVIMTPDSVVKVIYHIMAYCTNIEPNNERV